MSVWAGLDLMLAKAATETLVIEPKSHEDIEAAVRKPDDASLGVSASSRGGFRLHIQVKSRSTNPWTTKAFAAVLTGKQPDDKKSGGQARPRPLAILAGDPEARYVFVTNESLEQSLRPYAGEHLLDFTEERLLPPNSRKGFDAAAQASIAPRLLLCPGVTTEVLRARLERLLAIHGHVPRGNLPECIRDLRDDVRRRLTGHAGGLWTRDDLLSVVSGHGGSVQSTRAMDHYVRPRSYDAIRRSLDERHAVVIAGPSGTGKTLTADILEMELRQAREPFAVVGGERGPGHVRSQLTRTGPVLFHLRDPWGGNRLTPGAEQWSNELPKLLVNASPDRKFVITSRSDVLYSAGSGLREQLAPYLVRIDIEDYGGDRLARIYDEISGDLSEFALHLSRQYRTRALKTLTRPYEIDRFLAALQRENPEKPRKLDELLEESQIDAISRVVADQIGTLDGNGVGSAAIIWAMLSARGALAAELIPKLRRRMSALDPALRPDLEGTVEFLVAGRNLRQDGPELSLYHPRVEDGLRMAMLRRKADAEYVLSRLADALSAWDPPGDDWGIETALGVLCSVAKLSDFEVALAQATHARLDAYLESRVSRAQRQYDVERAFSDLAEYGSESHAPSRLARLLTQQEPATGWDLSSGVWRLSESSDVELAALRDDPRTQGLVERFVREILPFSRTRYDAAIVTVLGQLAGNLEDAFFAALKTTIAFGGPGENIDAIVAGLLSGEKPNFDRAIDEIDQELADVDNWLERESDDARRAEEHEVDADLADRIVEEPGERYYAPQHAMEVVVRLRREEEGLDWVRSHPHRDRVVHALAAIFAGTTEPRTSELRLVLECSAYWTRSQAWAAVAQHWDTDLKHELEAELARSDLAGDHLRKSLVEIAATASETVGDPVPMLAAIARGTSVERRLEMVSDVMAARLDNRRAHAAQLANTFEGEEADLGRALAAALDGDELHAVASCLSGSALSLLAHVLDTAPPSIASPLVCLASAAGMDTCAAAERLLGMDRVESGMTAVEVMVIDSRACAVDVLWRAFSHGRYPVRRAALLALAESTRTQDRVRLLAAADDRSADVRLAWADLMAEKHWPEAVLSLVKLLGDTRNFVTHHSRWSEQRIARAAANALGEYDSLPSEAIDALLAAAENVKNRDPFVPCAAISALAKRDDERISPMLLAALSGPGLRGAPQYRPIAQAASWAVFDRVTGGKMVLTDDRLVRIAVQGPRELAGPLLMAWAVQGGSQLERLISRLSAKGLTARLDLVWVAEAAAKQELDASVAQIYRSLAKLAHGKGQRGLKQTERDELESWSQALDPAHDVQLHTAYLAVHVFGLPVKSALPDPRAYSVPEKFEVLTLRSFTPAREEERGP